jgi:hypothetical protein
MPPPGQTQRAAQKFIVFENFEKMNTQSVRQALSEKELAWLENLQPIAGNNLTTVPGPVSPSLTSISETITSQFFANLGLIDYIISFTSVGGGWATNIATGVSQEFAPAGTFTDPDMTVWQSQYVLINDRTSGYSAWNGTVFVRQGGVSPNLVLLTGGSNFTSIPTVTITGGSGSGATAVATIGTPGVIAVNMTAGGSQYGPAPAVVFAGGGGSGAAGNANIDPRGLTSVTITNPGDYSSAAAPTVNFSGGGGAGAAGIANMVPAGGLPGHFQVASVTITNPGSNYFALPAVSFSGGSVITPATATCTVGNGQVNSVTMTFTGSGYTSAPTVSFTGGGSGSGAAATAVVGGSNVTSLTLTNPGSGYLASDVLTLTISGGGGTGATGTAHVFPFVTNGTTIAVFAGRVWLGGDRLLQWSGTLGFDDFNVANASGSLTIKDADLVHAITALRNYNNYLFIMGDQSVKQIGSISVSGSQTLFTILTLSSDQGSIYKRACGSFNRVFMFLNSNGVYAVLGSSVQKISDDMDGIFKLVDFAQQPQAALADINAIHNIAFLLRYKDPLASTRSVMLTFTGKKWFVISQGNGLMTIVTASTLVSGKTFLYGSSGQDITQLVGDPLTAVTFKAQTALSHHGNAVQRKKILNGGTAVTLATGTGNLTVTYDTEKGSVTKVYALVAGFQLPSGASGAEGSGRYLGATMTGTLAGFTLTNAALEEQETALWT